MIQRIAFAALSSLIVGTSASQIALSQQLTVSPQNDMAPSSVHEPAWVAQVKPETDSEQQQPNSALENADANVVQSSVEFARAHKYDGFFIHDIDEPGMANTQSRTYVQMSRVEPVPTKSSGLIVIATPTDNQPHFAAHRSDVYTELKLQVQEHIFTKTGNPDRDKLSILYPGGTIQSRNGMVVKRAVGSGTTPLDLGKRYLLFLTYEKSTDSFNILRAWDLSSEVPVLLDQNGSSSPLNEKLSFPSMASLETKIATDLSTYRGLDKH